MLTPLHPDAGAAPVPRFDRRKKGCPCAVVPSRGIPLTTTPGSYWEGLGTSSIATSLYSEFFLWQSYCPGSIQPFRVSSPIARLINFRSVAQNLAKLDCVKNGSTPFAAAPLHVHEAKGNRGRGMDR